MLKDKDKAETLEPIFTYKCLAPNSTHPQYTSLPVKPKSCYSPACCDCLHLYTILLRMPSAPLFFFLEIPALFLNQLLKCYPHGLSEQPQEAVAISLLGSYITENTTILASNTDIEIISSHVVPPPL